MIEKAMSETPHASTRIAASRRRMYALTPSPTCEIKVPFAVTSANGTITRVQQLACQTGAPHVNRQVKVLAGGHSAVLGRGQVNVPTRSTPAQTTTCSRARFAHAEGVAFGDDDHRVMQQAFEERRRL